MKFYQVLLLTLFTMSIPLALGAQKKRRGCRVAPYSKPSGEQPKPQPIHPSLPIAAPRPSAPRPPR